MSFFAFQPLVLNGKNIEEYTVCQIVMQIGKSLRFGHTIWQPFRFIKLLSFAFPDFCGWLRLAL
ncbi:hypothetical protein, partial [uncultured Muribaculum sp.]|uniref:hypothetical protein n=1 Tax=uncultured Muribaculum sp. TaxID=1918613 RepID=UPI00272D2BD4